MRLRLQTRGVLVAVAFAVLLAAAFCMGLYAVGSGSTGRSGDEPLEPSLTTPSLPTR